LRKVRSGWSNIRVTEAEPSGAQMGRLGKTGWVVGAGVLVATYDLGALGRKKREKK